MKDNTVYLRHILDAIQKIEGYLLNIDSIVFDEDEMRFSATVRQLMIIGEAANRVSQEFRKKHIWVDWGEMIGMRNFLIHQYFGVNKKTV